MASSRALFPYIPSICEYRSCASSKKRHRFTRLAFGGDVTYPHNFTLLVNHPVVGTFYLPTTAEYPDFEMALEKTSPIPGFELALYSKNSSPICHFHPTHFAILKI